MEEFLRLVKSWEDNYNLTGYEIILILFAVNQALDVGIEFLEIKAG